MFNILVFFVLVVLEHVLSEKIIFIPIVTLTKEPSGTVLKIEKQLVDTN